jgi:peptidoglycan hydrolase-like protein with peptidoglycan-binding domain
MKRTLVISAGVALVLAGGVGGRARLSRGSDDGSASEPKLPAANAEVTRTTLVETKTVAGTLGYGETVPVGATSQGTVTSIAAIGSTVNRGDPLFKIDERPVVALYGPVPMYRTMGEGAAGADVNQLEANLSALGYTGFTVDNDFTAETAAAVRDWQTNLGLAATGTVEPGQVVFTPGPVRIADHTARVGATTGDCGEAVLSYTGTTRLVTVELRVADQALAVQGRKVSVTIPGGNSVEGTIATVGTVAATQQQASNNPEQGGSATADARLAVTVEIADQQALGTLDAAPVDLDFVSQARENVLAVPVAALLALPKGGYGVEIVEGLTTRIVAVKTGLFAAGRVEISGDGIDQGIKVGVPSDAPG